MPSLDIGRAELMMSIVLCIKFIRTPFLLPSYGITTELGAQRPKQPVYCVGCL